MTHSGRCTLWGPSVPYSDSPWSSSLPAAASKPLLPEQRGHAIAECRRRKKKQHPMLEIAKAPHSKTRPIAPQRRSTSMIVLSSLSSPFEGCIGGNVYRAGFVQDSYRDDSAIQSVRKRDRTSRNHGIAARPSLAAFCFLLAAIMVPSATLSNPLPTGSKRVVSSEVSIAQIRPGLTLRFNQRPIVTATHPHIETDSSLKRMAEQAAATHTLPTDYFLRLIRQESGFNPNSISRAGAQGIAQFMPATAFDRGLKDPFDPAEALPKSAELLNELRDQFGNLGLAAAAYNAGPERIRRWLAGKSHLPRETIDYVRVITGHDAVDWAKSNDLAINPGSNSFSPSSRTRFNRLSWEAQLLATLQSARADGSTPSTAPTSAPKLGESSLCSRCIVQSAY
jgi:Transglycosylase SLT domain